MRNAKDMDGICVQCKEWTTVFEPCCGLVIVEGSTVDPCDFCAECGDELGGYSDCQRCDLKPKGDS